MPHLVALSQTAGNANPAERAALRLSGGSAVIRATRIHRDLGGAPLAYDEVVWPVERFSGATLDPTLDLVELAGRHGISLGHATEHLAIVSATPELAGHLGIAAGANVVKSDRVVESTDGLPVEWRIAWSKIP